MSLPPSEEIVFSCGNKFSWSCHVHVPAQIQPELTHFVLAEIGKPPATQALNGHM